MEKAAFESQAAKGDDKAAQQVAAVKPERYCPACLEVHPRSICMELTRGLG